MCQPQSRQGPMEQKLSGAGGGCMIALVPKKIKKVKSAIKNRLESIDVNNSVQGVD